MAEKRKVYLLAVKSTSCEHRDLVKILAGAIKGAGFIVELCRDGTFIWYEAKPPISKYIFHEINIEDGFLRSSTPNWIPSHLFYPFTPN